MTQEVRGQLRREELRRLYDYWDQARGGKELPARADIDPVDVPDLLANIILVDVRHRPVRFFDRLVGTAIVARMQRDTTGEELTGLSEPISDHAIACYRHCVDSRVPYWAETTSPCARDGTLVWERLILPLSTDGKTIDMLLAGVYYEPERRRDRSTEAHVGKLLKDGIRRSNVRAMKSR